MGSITEIFIETTKIPRDRYKKSGDRVFLNNICIVERREPDKQGNTHTVYLYKKDAPKEYIGAGKVIVFNEAPLNDDDLPPGADDIEDAHIEQEQPF